jgi:NTP pyrophosphohydrolases including oxidative damage repair enzymes
VDNDGRRGAAAGDGEPRGARSRQPGVSRLPLTLRGLETALHPLAAIPRGPAWNLDEVVDLLPDAAPIPAAVLVGLVPRDSGIQVLLTRRTDALRHHAGQVAFPGGRIEPGDVDASAAALRETGEEIGLPGSDLAPIGWLDPLATVTGFTVLPLVAAVSPGYRPHPDPREVAEVFEVPLDFLMHAPNLRRVELDWRGRPRTVLEFADRGMPARRIWGATASILLNLRQRLEGVR